MKKIFLKTDNEQKTRNIARIVADVLPCGMTIALDGDLAAGKSVFSSAYIKKLGYDGKVTSPTYTIMNEYETPNGTAYHMDAYRLSGSDELDFIGYYDAVESCAVMLIEWAEIIEDALSHDALYINIAKDDENPDVRIFEMSGREDIIDKLTEALNDYIIR